MNDTLGRKHVRLLKKIKRSRVLRFDQNQVNDLKYLYDLGLIEVVSCPKEDDYYFEASGLTEKGEAALDNQILRHRDRRLPYAAFFLSILAIIISILSLIINYLSVYSLPD